MSFRPQRACERSGEILARRDEDTSASLEMTRVKTFGIAANNQTAGRTKIPQSIIADQPLADATGVLWPCRKLPEFPPGDWDETRAAFSQAETCDMQQAWRATPQDELQPSRVQIGWREETFWVFAEMTDLDIVNPASRLNEETYKLGDTFEIFIADKRLPHYLELHVSPFNQQMQLWVPRARHSHDDHEWQTHFIDEPIFQSWTQVPREENRWRVLAAIPTAQLSEKESIQPGVEWLASFSRYDYTTGKKRPILSSTSLHHKLDFHRQKEWRTLVFC